ncbi:unnamed protein product [marine sediment metagenome]|uniref:Winged helix DNA-binding domain-containing protein n=1 Tax=marine sediment metagenome TaxID=412755 RepID=X1I661_9ZZZZ
MSEKSGQGSDGAVYTHIKKLVQAGYIAQDKRITGNKGQTNYTL